MQVMQLNVSNDICDKVISFLESLPKNKVQLKLEERVDTCKQKHFNPKEFFGLSDSSKNEIDEYLAKSKEEWGSFIKYE
jgi:hypothetical protein